jgi:hypothetical protein
MQQEDLSYSIQSGPRIKYQDYLDEVLSFVSLNIEFAPDLSIGNPATYQGLLFQIT